MTRPPPAPKNPRPVVVLGLLGTQLDLGSTARRFDRWRPTVSLCQQDDLLVARLELLCDRRFEKLAHQVAQDAKLVSPETDTRVHTLDLSAPWDFESVYRVLYDFARGYEFRTDDEEYLVHITTGSHVAQICLFLLTESRHLPGRLIQTAPPKRRGPPSGTYSVIDLDLRRYDPIARRFEREHREAASLLKSGIATRNARFNRQIEQIERVGLESTAPILLMGPTGAGKSQLATRIYELRRARHRLEGPFVEVNCATLRGDAAMSALFGHRRGAFTGANTDRPGLLRSADGGMLFLDEIGTLGLDEQAMLLRALEEGRFLPVGSDREVESRFQLVAGTNHDLRRAVLAGDFRDDLLARINLWTFALPGLRERIEDLEPNVDFELERFAERQGRRVTFNHEARRRYLEFAISREASWRGNFRDLNGSIVRMATLAPGGRIDESVVDEEIERLRGDWLPGGEARTGSLVELVLGPEQAERIDLFDRVQLEAVLEVCREARSLSAAGRTLFAASRERRRSTNDADRLRKYLARFSLDFRSIEARLPR